MSNTDNNLGLKTSGDDLNWRNLNNDHEDNPVVTALVKDAEKLFSDEIVNENVVILSNELLFEFNKFLLDNRLGLFFDVLFQKDEKSKDKKSKKDDKKKKKEVIKKSDLMKLNIEKEKNKKEIQKFIKNLKLDDNCYPIKKNKLHEAFLNIIYWSCYLIKNYNSEKINTEMLCDASVSLLRAIHDCETIINDDIRRICFEILDKLEKCMKKRNSNYVYDLLSKYYYIITTSCWDKEKPNNIVLYDEQKEAILKINDSIVNDTPLLLFYWVPPANGKTLVSTIIAKTISNYFKGKSKNKFQYYDAKITYSYSEEGPFTVEFDDGTEQDDVPLTMIRPVGSNKLRNKNLTYELNQRVQAQKFINPKIMLYICYNDIVRNSVSSLCVTHNVDIKFWIATYRQDKYKPDIHFVDLRPYKNCYPDWRKKKSPKLYKLDEANNEKRYSPILREQMLQYLDETRLISIREKELNNEKKFFDNAIIERCQNLPEMIISDLDSAYELLKEFPDMFIPYFDEAFAASNQMITSKIMSVLPKTSVLVSATLAAPDKIPTILSNFRDRHSIDDSNDDYIQTIRTGKQHINCDFISPDGDLISPFHHLNNASEIDEFMTLVEKNPVIERGFSNLIVLKMFENLKSFLPEDDNLLFVEHIGNITNTNIREYGKKLLKFCSNNEEYFSKIKKISIKKINDNNIYNIFTKNAYIYNNQNTLHVSNPEHFGTYLTDITSEFLKDSPILKRLINDYKKSRESIENVIKNIEKNVKDDNDGTKNHRLEEEYKKLGEIKFNYPSEFILNSLNHFRKYHSRGTLSDPKSMLFNSDVINNLDDVIAKLYLSTIGVYNQSTLNNYELEVFLKYKDLFKFIISDPSIIYGTNLNITMIDIHENLSSISTRNTMYQLIGRGGRFGKSSSAVVNFRSWDLFNIIVDNNDINEEATNIEKNLIEIMNDTI